ncbi:MAG: ATP-binding protein [Opitutales bacterium]|nr:ATP-binding protein [Opitutales bacterium]
MQFERHLWEGVREALKDTPVVLLTGARQTGKTTLVRALADSAAEPRRYVTLDDPATLSAAGASPVSFVEDLGGRATIDEVQRAPEIFLALKRAVDAGGKPGCFLLSGSANVFVLPRVADSLAGRMEVLTLWPLSQGEIEGHREFFVDACFGTGDFESGGALRWPEVVDRMVRGGYPEAIRRTDPARRRAWWNSYVLSLLERDVRDLANIEALRELPRLLGLLAARAGGLLNFADLSRTVGISATSLKRYMGLFGALYLYVELPAWFRNLEKRLAKSPKIYLNDTGLICHLRGMDGAALAGNRERAGPVLENFVVLELRKQLGWSATGPRMYHFRDAAGAEVDIVLEAPDGRLAGIEVKAASDVSINDFRGLRRLADTVGSDFVRGVVLYTGSERLAFGERLTALPVAALWRS